MGAVHHAVDMEQRTTLDLLLCSPGADPSGVFDQDELEMAVPSSTVSLSANKADARNPNSAQAHARQLRVLLESLNDVQRSRAQLVARATRLADSEDITPRVLKAAAAIERWVEVQPSMFEDVLDEELAKYEKFRVEIEEGEQKQGRILNSVKVCLYHASRTTNFHSDCVSRNAITYSCNRARKIHL